MKDNISTPSHCKEHILYYSVQTTVLVEDGEVVDGVAVEVRSKSTGFSHGLGGKTSLSSHTLLR